MSAAALCQMDVAAHYAADPVAASKLAARASFDCAKAQTPLEKAICSDISLGYADIVLSRVSSGLLKNSDQTDKATFVPSRSEEHTSELQSQSNLVCRLLLEKKK